MELIFPIAAPTVLCFVLVAGRMLIRHKYFGCCQSSAGTPSAPTLQHYTYAHLQAGDGKILEGDGDRARRADFN